MRFVQHDPGPADLVDVLVITVDQRVGGDDKGGFRGTRDELLALGARKAVMDQRSPTLFSTGVPVRAMRNPAESERAALDCLVSGFLIFCASSSTMPAQRTWLRCS